MSKNKLDIFDDAIPTITDVPSHMVPTRGSLEERLKKKKEFDKEVFDNQVKLNQSRKAGFDNFKDTSK